jgi:hypothetical protein
VEAGKVVVVSGREASGTISASFGSDMDLASSGDEGPVGLVESLLIVLATTVAAAAAIPAAPAPITSSACVGVRASRTDEFPFGLGVSSTDSYELSPFWRFGRAGTGGGGDEGGGIESG